MFIGKTSFNSDIQPGIGQKPQIKVKILNDHKIIGDDEKSMIANVQTTG